MSILVITNGRMQYVRDEWDGCEDCAWYYRFCAMESEKSHLVATQTNLHRSWKGGRGGDDRGSISPRCTGREMKHLTKDS